MPIRRLLVLHCLLAVCTGRLVKLRSKLEMGDPTALAKPVFKVVEAICEVKPDEADHGSEHPKTEAHGASQIERIGISHVEP